jgi:hypothetical protein
VNKAEGPVHYEIRVKGILDAKWTDWFDSLLISTAPRRQGRPTGPPDASLANTRFDARTQGRSPVR